MSQQQQIIVYCIFWCKSYHFKQELYKGTLEEASQYADAKCQRNSTVGSNWSAHVVASEAALPLKPRRLTLKERLLGVAR